VLAMDFHATSVTGHDYPQNGIAVSLISTGFNDRNLLEAPIRKQLAKLNPDQQTFSIDNLETWIANRPEWPQEHLAAWVFAAFAVLAALLAAIGYTASFPTLSRSAPESSAFMALGAALGDPAHCLRSQFRKHLRRCSHRVNPRADAERDDRTLGRRQFA
jgi:hypothetical protein